MKDAELILLKKHLQKIKNIKIKSICTCGNAEVTSRIWPFSPPWQGRSRQICFRKLKNNAIALSGKIHM